MTQPLARFAESYGLNHREEVLADGTIRQYVHTADNSKRYALIERWKTEGSLVLWVMLNPGTGEIEQRPRRTLERCRAWSRGWGHAGLLIGNLFAHRSKAAVDLDVGDQLPDTCNEKALVLLRSLASEVIAAWGVPPKKDKAAARALEALGEVNCLGITLHGHPRHPLYVPRNAQRVAYSLTTHATGA